MTDGYIGNETEILGEIHRRLGSSRIFSFGIGTSVNRYLIESMGKMGRGAVAFVGSDTAGEQAIDAFYNRICHPAMTDISIDWGDMRVTDVYPSRLPDLFVGRPVLVTGRFTGAPDAPIRITGEVGNRTREIVQPVRMYETDYARAGIASVWARMKIADIAERATWSSDQDLGYQIRDVALEYGLMSAYTAFVAVDSMTRTAGRYGTTVVVPEPVPEGVRYETTVDE
jgi:Ca-activated chloride channel family protein